MTIHRAPDSVPAAINSTNGRYHGRHAGDATPEITLAPEPSARWPESPGDEGLALPAGIAAAAHEAHLAFEVGAYRGAVLLARATIEACAADQHAAATSLPARIRELGARQVISPLTQRAAAGLATLPLDSGHLGQLGLVDAEEALGVMNLILEDVYLRPAQLRRIEGLRHAAPVGPPVLAVARLSVRTDGRHRQPED
jgi:hypothetical protein